MLEKKISIALIDDHQLLTEALERYLNRYEFIGTIKTFTSPQNFINGIDFLSTDIVICDIMMPSITGIEFLETIKKERKKIKVIMLTAITEVQTIRHAMRIGASGYLAKDTSPDELADAILTVYNGEPYIGESLRKSLIRNAFVEEQFIYSLSPREKEVLKFVCSGKTIKETAYEMGLSTNTVQTYYKSILKKFNLNRTADLIVFAIQNGLYNPSLDTNKNSK